MMTPFFVKDKRVFRKIHPEEVVYFITKENYTKICLADGKVFTVRSSLSNAIQKFPHGVFFRTSRSVAVSIFYMDNISRDHLTVGEQIFPIAKGYYDPLINGLNIFE